jgi:WD40 repeat protein
VKVWDTATGQESLTLKGHTGQVARVAFSPDGKHLATAGEDRTVRLWDVTTGETIRTIKGHTNWVLGVAFSPDGRHLASASKDNFVKVWDAASGQEILTFQGHTGWVMGVAFNPDGRRLASAGDATVRLWDTDTGQNILTLKHTGPAFNVAFSPDGRRLASATQDSTVKVWDATEVTPERRIEHEARGLVQWLFEESPLPALPVKCATTAGLLASPLGQGHMLAASALIPERTPLPSEVAAAVERDPSITEAVRQKALAWVQHFGRIQARASRPAQ